MGFTLIELLIGIAIMGIMAGMVLYTLAGAQEDSKRAKTKATIEKLNAVILERFEEYRYRSVRIPIPSTYTRRDPSKPNAVPLLSPRVASGIRTVTLKDMMRMEMPDRFSDLAYTPCYQTFTLSDGNTYNINQFGGRYLPREYNVLRNNFGFVSVTPDPYTGSVVASTSASWSSTWDSAECLYAIIASSTVAGGSALEGFHASEIGDVDGDSFPEFVDAWGQPIAWIRWPAGYPSELNLNYKQMVTPADGSASMPNSPDAFDPYKTDAQWTNTQKPWTLIPIIFSAGPDGDFGVNFDSTAIFATGKNPYHPGTDASPSVGSVTNANALADNITSHDLMLE